MRIDQWMSIVTEGSECPSHSWACLIAEAPLASGLLRIADAQVWRNRCQPSDPSPIAFAAGEGSCPTLG